MKLNICAVLSVFSLCIASCFTPGQSARSGQTASQTNPNTQKPADPAARADADAANWDIKKLDTAANAAYLSAVEKDIILEMNKVRSDPKKYADLYIAPMTQYFKGKTYTVPGQVPLMTDEGASAVTECANVLRKAKGVGLLSPERGLSLAAQAHTADQGRTGQVGHNGSDKSTTEVRLKRYGSFSGSWTFGENIAYGSKTAREIVCSLLVDDGVSDRGHRDNIMRREFTQAGAGYGTHPQYRTVSTMCFANGYKSN